MPASRDPTLDVLLDLDGQVLVVDPEGHHWVRFVVTRVPAPPGQTARDWCAWNGGSGDGSSQPSPMIGSRLRYR